LKPSSLKSSPASSDGQMVDCRVVTKVRGQGQYRKSFTTEDFDLGASERKSLSPDLCYYATKHSDSSALHEPCGSTPLTNISRAVMSSVYVKNSVHKSKIYLSSAAMVLDTFFTLFYTLIRHLGTY